MKLPTTCSSAVVQYLIGIYWSFVILISSVPVYLVSELLSAVSVLQRFPSTQHEHEFVSSSQRCSLILTKPNPDTHKERF